ncbi:glucose-6-phosphate isomerase [Kordiimonas sp.]|uniref:glucose-6-phosphate isomerase n=1 Tax=Kordiimonas sp. TaxID=1970157 RepID=UPI003A93C906
MFSYSFGNQSLETLLEAAGLTAAFNANLEKAVTYAKGLAADGLLPFARQAADGPDMEPIAQAAARITANADDLIVLGTGGSSLGAQAAIAIARFNKGTVRIHTPDSLCPFEMDLLFKELEPRRTHVLAVSKSGTTAETLAQLLACRAWIEAGAHAADLGDHFTFITEPGDRPLRTYGEKLGSPILDHPTDVGGRFSVLTNVGMLPVAVSGLSVRAFREGAKEVCDNFIAHPETATAVVGAALTQTLNEHKDITQVLIMPYAESLRAFTRWHGQLWAESLGKDGLGTTPIRAVGPVDQHSQLQLFLDGPNDKFCTFVTIPSYGKGPRIDPAEAKAYGLDYMAGRTIGDTVTCQSRATQETLRAKGRTVREIVIDGLSEQNLGGLFVSFMLETVVTAHLMGVNAFDQPAVEEGKILTRQYLNELDIE